MSTKESQDPVKVDDSSSPSTELDGVHKDNEGSVVVDRNVKDQVVPSTSKHM